MGPQLADIEGHDGVAPAAEPPADDVPKLIVVVVGAPARSSGTSSRRGSSIPSRPAPAWCAQGQLARPPLHYLVRQGITFAVFGRTLRKIEDRFEKSLNAEILDVSTPF